MRNHVHLLVEKGKEDISITMKKIGVRYVWYYNWKYKHTGHLFQDGYKCENIDTDEYLLTIIRYIHLNPVKAGLVNQLNEFKWSSCRSYYDNEEYPVGITDTELILGIFSDIKESAILKFKEFNESDNGDICIDIGNEKRITDDEAGLEIKKLLGSLSY